MGSFRRVGADSASLRLRLLAFAALAAFGVGHWVRLLEDPPVARLALAAAVAVALGAALAALGRAGLPRAALHAAAAAATAIGASLALVAIGLPVGMLAPGQWGDLGREFGDGLAGLPDVGWPHERDDSVRLVVTLGAPLLLTFAAAAAFWPLRRGLAAAARAAALVALLVLYGVPATEHDPGRPLLWGAVLLALVAAWLWLPRLRARDALPAAATVAAVALLALPAAARLNSGSALVDYRGWDWLGGKGVSFDWNHSYGPLDWPREGTTLLTVRAARPHYWKAETLDRFDGLRWVRSSLNERSSPAAELPSRPDRRWGARIRVIVRALTTDFVVGAGTPTALTGLDESVTGSADGTVRTLDEPLRRGDSYAVDTFDPDPSARELRATPAGYLPALAQYTTVVLPPRGVDALDRVRPGVQRGPPRGEVVEVPPRGGLWTGGRDPAPRLAASPYRKTYALARRLAAGAPTTYDVVKRIERHLERAYAYSERPPSRRYPLESFLFEDRIGYCQQFSGAMGLMLRMLGIPARVVSGFSPGSLSRDRREYRVRDLDAHSWVEAYFSGVGWVTFDPTPAAAPADRPGRERASTEAAPDSAGAISSGGRASPGGDRPTAPARDAGDQGGGLSWVAALALAAVLLLSAAGVVRRRRRRAAEPTAADASLAEIRRALPSLGWPVAPGTTLLELEQRLGVAGPDAARYVSLLREGRFGRAGAAAPGAAERRALRRALTAGGGLGRRLRGYLALPPSWPFRGA